MAKACCLGTLQVMSLNGMTFSIAMSSFHLGQDLTTQLIGTYGVYNLASLKCGLPYVLRDWLGPRLGLNSLQQIQKVTPTLKLMKNIVTEQLMRIK